MEVSNIKCNVGQKVYNQPNIYGIKLNNFDYYNKVSHITIPNGIVNPSNVFYVYFPSQLIQAFSSKASVDEMVKNNPKIKEILNKYEIEYSVNTKNIRDIIPTHIQTTKSIALQIANEMNLSVLDKKQLELACIFHDFGKILIPSEIVNKKGELTDSEKEIMSLHSQLGYELLSTTKLDKRVLQLIKNHHSNIEENHDVLGQILSVADIYSALREQRSYKKPLSNKESLDILDQKAKNGEVSAEVVDVLKQIVNTSNIGV